ncbi:MAG: hypothetical protein LBU10_02355 [Endomicrobium sp.]|jgi:hypothetical protein|nr:hypothetical protein [Endomicrobium sp.]
MKKIVMVTITSMTILANIFAQDTKPIEILESKNEVCIVIDKTILRSACLQDIYGKTSTTYNFGKWITDFRIVADYYRYIAKNNSLGLGLGININPYFDFYAIYGSTKIKVPLTNRWFLGVGAGLGNVNTVNEYKANLHQFFKLFTSFNFKNISIHLSYTQDILCGFYKKENFTERFETLNLGIGKRFMI